MAVKCLQGVIKGGGAIAPVLAGYIATKTSLGFSILLISVTARLIATVFMGWAGLKIIDDIKFLRVQMPERSLE